MKRFISVLAVALLMVAMLMALAGPAIAADPGTGDCVKDWQTVKVKQEGFTPASVYKVDACELKPLPA